MSGPTVAALFVQTGGAYFNNPDIDPWDEQRDARRYMGPLPVVAHPPCNLWCKMAAVNWARYGGEHNRPGNDGGCFASALDAVHNWGGVIEHPADTRAFEAHGIDRPVGLGWQMSGMAGICGSGWTCEVWQSAYGHKANKRTWLYYYSPFDNPPLAMDWSRLKGTHQIGWHGKTPKERSKPTISGKAASATPPAFRDVLIRLAKWSRGDK